MSLAIIGIGLAGTIAVWLTSDGRNTQVVDISSVDSWATAERPPIYSSELAKSLLLVLKDHYAVDADANGIVEIQIFPRIGFFCLLPPRDRAQIYLSATKRFTPEGMAHLNDLIEHCGLVLLKKQRKSKKPIYLAYFGAGENAKPAEISVTLRDADILVTVMAYAADDVRFKMAAMDRARTHISQ